MKAIVELSGIEINGSKLMAEIEGYPDEIEEKAFKISQIIAHKFDTVIKQ